MEDHLVAQKCLAGCKARLLFQMFGMELPLVLEERVQVLCEGRW